MNIDDMVKKVNNRNIASVDGNYSPSRKNMPPDFPIQPKPDKKNAAKRAKAEPFNRILHLTEDVADKVSPYMTKKPF